MQSLSTVVTQKKGHAARWGRSTCLVWQDELEQIKADDELGIEVCEPKAVVVQHLELPEKCQERTARYLEKLSFDWRKVSDVRDLRRTGLQEPAAAEVLEVAKHPECCILQFWLALKFVCGRCMDFAPDWPHLAVTLKALLKEQHQVDYAEIYVGAASQRHSGFTKESRISVALRVSSPARAQLLKEALEGLAEELQQAVSIETLLPEVQGATYHDRTRDSDFAMSARFRLELSDLRVIGGQILDLIDPSRASIDPMCGGSFFPPAPAKAKIDDEEDWQIPLRRDADGGRSRMADAPRWIPARVEVDAKSQRLRFGEISGIPWMGRGTTERCGLYHCLNQVITAMQPLFEKLGRPLLTGGQAKVIVKSQIYQLRPGEEILGQMHKEGGDFDHIESVGLYYPHVDDTLSGGDLEITISATGGCGSRYPMSKSVPVRSGTAIVFDNLKAYHRMTALRTASEEGGRRSVIGFFVVREGLYREAPTSEVTSDSLTVNYGDKARSMLRQAIGAEKLPRHIFLQIERCLSGRRPHFTFHSIFLTKTIQSQTLEGFLPRSKDVRENRERNIQSLCG